jgi:hypothetical protein
MKWLSNLIHLIDRKKDRHYVSDADRFLQNFDREHPEQSASQLSEIKKHANIFNRKTSSRINWN